MITPPAPGHLIGTISGDRGEAAGVWQRSEWFRAARGYVERSGMQQCRQKGRYDDTEGGEWHSARRWSQRADLLVAGRRRKGTERIAARQRPVILGRQRRTATGVEPSPKRSAARARLYGRSNTWEPQWLVRLSPWRASHLVSEEKDATGRSVVTLWMRGRIMKREMKRRDVA